jgi:hypothetical protein
MHRATATVPLSHYPNTTDDTEKDAEVEELFENDKS